MRRLQHFLAANKGCQSPQALVFVDTETREHRLNRTTVEHRLWFGWSCYQRTIGPGLWSAPDWFRFTKAPEFWDWLTSHTRPKTRTYCFAHNWSFDGPVLDVWNAPGKCGWTLTRAVIESPPVILTYRREERTLTLLDTLNFWRTSLSAIGESLQVPKLPMPSRRAGPARWDTYCRRDVEVIRLAVMRWIDFLQSHNLGGFAPTLAAQAMRTYRHAFMDHPILIDSNQQATALARESYHGGRVECFRLGKVKGPVYCLDVNSMYPHVMREGYYPTILRLHTRSAGVSQLRDWLNRYCVVARVRLRVSEPRYSVVRDDKLLFPVGRVETVLTTPDLVTALERGELVKVLEVAVYDRARIFTRFVDTMYANRLAAFATGDTLTATQWKILLNSLYGKFGQRGRVWELVGDAPDDTCRVWSEVDADTGVVRSFRQFSGKLQRLETDPESAGSFPAIAAHVTAYARAHLWSLICVAGRGNVYYCDTDSLYLNRDGWSALADRQHTTTLGALKNVGTYKWIVLRGPKDYTTPAGDTIKGVRSSAVWLDGNTVCQDQWSSLKGQLRQSATLNPTTKRIVKRLSRTYTKGVARMSGLVEPFSFDDW